MSAPAPSPPPHDGDNGFPFRTGDAIIFDRNCHQLNLPAGWAICKLAKKRGPPYDHVGPVIVQKEGPPPPPTASDAAVAEKQQHVALGTDSRVQVIDANFPRLVVRPLSAVVKRRYNGQLLVRCLLNDADGSPVVAGGGGDASVPAFDAMRDRANAVHGVRYKRVRSWLDFAASLFPAFPDRVDAATVLNERLMRQRLAIAVAAEEKMASASPSSSALFAAVARRRHERLRREMSLLHRAYVARRTALDRSALRYIVGVNDSHGEHNDAGFFCSEVTVDVLQKGRVVDTFPPATCFQPTDFPLNAPPAQSDLPFAFSQLTVNPHSVFAAPVEIKPSTPERGVLGSSGSGVASVAAAQQARLSWRERQRLDAMRPSVAGAIQKELQHRGLSAKFSGGADDHLPITVQPGQIVWLDERHVASVFTGSTHCVLVRENVRTAEGVAARALPPMLRLASPAAGSFFFSSDARAAAEGRIGLLAKSKGTLWCAPPPPVAAAQQTPPRSSPPPLLDTIVLAPGAALPCAPANEPATLYAVLEGELVSADGPARRSYFASDVVGAQELMARTLGAFPVERLGGWENDVARDWALQLPFNAPAQPLLSTSELPGLRAGPRGAVVVPVSASETLMSTAIGSGAADETARQFRLVASAAVLADANCRLSTRDADLLLFEEESSSPSRDSVSSALRHWLLFGGRVASQHCSARPVEFGDVKRAATTLSQILLLQQEGAASSPDLDGEIFAAALLEPLFELWQSRSDCPPIGVAEVNAALEAALFGSAQLSAGGNDFLVVSGSKEDDLLAADFLLPDALLSAVRGGGTVQLGGRGRELVRVLHALARDTVATASAVREPDASLLAGLLRGISGGWSSRNALAAAASGTLLDDCGLQEAGGATVCTVAAHAGDVVKRLWLAVLSCLASSYAIVWRSEMRSGEWARRGWLANAVNLRAVTLADTGIALSLETFALRALACRALLACAIHSALLFAALKCMAWSDRKKAERTARRVRDSSGSEDDLRVVGVTHPRWRCLRAAVVTGVAASLLTQPLEAALFGIVNGRRLAAARLLRPHRSLLALSAFTAAPYVAASQWLYMHELLLPLGVVSPAASPSFLFPDFDVPAQRPGGSSGRRASFDWLAADANAMERSTWVGGAMVAAAAVVHPLETFRRAAVAHGAATPSEIAMQYLREHGATRLVRRAFAGFGGSLCRMSAANIVSYSLFAAAMRVTGC